MHGGKKKRARAAAEKSGCARVHGPSGHLRIISVAHEARWLWSFLLSSRPLTLGVICDLNNASFYINLHEIAGFSGVCNFRRLLYNNRWICARKLKRIYLISLFYHRLRDGKNKGKGVIRKAVLHNIV